jgi:hypothetical protein
MKSWLIESESANRRQFGAEETRGRERMQRSRRAKMERARVKRARVELELKLSGGECE